MGNAFRPNLGERTLGETIQRYPVTFTTCALAIAATITWHTGGSVEAYVLDDHIWSGEAWRIVTCIFPHVSFFHLLFNLYWTWRFGLAVEEFYRWKGTLGILLLFAVFSSLASYCAGENGVGLSGVGYGLFGMLWVLSRRDTRFRGAVDSGTTLLFVVWFFLCIALTWANLWNVGNVAHGSGAVVGVLAGYALANLLRGRTRLFSRIGLCAMILLATLGASLRSPPLDVFGSHGAFLGRQGWIALENEEYEEAIPMLEEAVARDSTQVMWLWNLGCAYWGANRRDDAVLLFRKILDLRTHTPVDLTFLYDSLKFVGWAEMDKGNYGKAVDLFEEARQIHIGDEELEGWMENAHRGLEKGEKE